MVEVVLVVRGRVAVRKVSSTLVHVGPVCTVSAPQASVGGRPALVV